MKQGASQTSLPLTSGQRRPEQAHRKLPPDERQRQRKHNAGRKPCPAGAQLPHRQHEREPGVKEGATVKMPPTDMFWGDRYCALTDPSGHSWSIATHVKEVSTEEAQAAASSMGACPDVAAE